MQTLSFEDLNGSKVKGLIAGKKSFEVIGLSGKVSDSAKKIEKLVESSGMRCRVYTAGRVAAAGATVVGGVTGLLGAVSAVAIASHNLATWKPDYEIAKNIIDNKVTVKYKGK